MSFVCSRTIKPIRRSSSSNGGSFWPAQYSRKSALEHFISNATDCASPTKDTAMAIRREHVFGRLAVRVPTFLRWKLFSGDLVENMREGEQLAIRHAGVPADPGLEQTRVHVQQ